MATQTHLNLAKPPAKTPSLHETVLDVLKKYGPRKDVVLIEQLGATESHFSEVKNGKKHWPEPWLKKITEEYDHDNQIPACIAGWRGLVVRPPRVMSDSEWKRRMLFVLRKHDGIGEAFVAEAMALPDEGFADEAEP